MGSDVTEAVFWASNAAVRVPGLRFLGRAQPPPEASSPRDRDAHNHDVSPSSSSSSASSSNNVSPAQAQEAQTRSPLLKVATWNLLAPPYARDSLEKQRWRARAEKQREIIAALDPDVAALQEFWTASEENVALWASWAFENDYALVLLPRTGGKQDGCATLVKSRYFPPSETVFGLGYDDWGDRVCLVIPLPAFDVVVGNTHWTFSHDNAWDPVMRRHQARKLSKALKHCSRAVLMGDFNGSADEPALLVFQDEGFTLHQPEDPTWVSHLAHTGAYLACDFVATKGFVFRDNPNDDNDDTAASNVAAHGPRTHPEQTPPPPPNNVSPPMSPAQPPPPPPPPLVAVAEDLRLHGDKRDLAVKAHPEYRVSDHLMLSATLRLPPASA